MEPPHWRVKSGASSWVASGGQYIDACFRLSQSSARSLPVMHLLEAVWVARKRLRQSDHPGQSESLGQSDTGDPAAEALREAMARPPVAPAALRGAAAQVTLAAAGARMALNDMLWGDSCLLPGGGAEVLRLAAPLGCNSTNTLLLLGAGLAGPARALAEGFGTYINALEADAALMPNPQLRRGLQMPRTVTMRLWEPGHPAFRPAAHAACLALEPMRHASPAEVLPSMAASLRPAGQILLVDLVRGPSASAAQLAEWARIERRTPNLPGASAITECLQRLGFDVPVVEDISRHQAHLAIAGWRALLRRMEQERPEPALAAAMVDEAERWLLRLRLMRLDGMRLMRWHAIRSKMPEG